MIFIALVNHLVLQKRSLKSVKGEILHSADAVKFYRSFTSIGNVIFTILKWRKCFAMYWHCVGLLGLLVHIVLILFNFERCWKNGIFFAEFFSALLDGLINKNYINCVLMNNWFPLKAEANIFLENSRTPSHLKLVFTVF